MGRPGSPSTRRLRELHEGNAVASETPGTRSQRRWGAPQGPSRPRRTSTPSSARFRSLPLRDDVRRGCGHVEYGICIGAKYGNAPIPPWAGVLRAVLRTPRASLWTSRARRSGARTWRSVLGATLAPGRGLTLRLSIVRGRSTTIGEKTAIFRSFALRGGGSRHLRSGNHKATTTLVVPPRDCVRQWETKSYGHERENGLATCRRRSGS